MALVRLAQMERLILKLLTVFALAFSGVQVFAQPLDNANTPAAKTRDADSTGGWWHQNIWDDPERGFYWYPPDRPAKPEKEAKEEDKTAPKKTVYEMTSSEEVNKELKRLLDVAIFNPTEGNLYEYQKAKAWVLEKAAVFTDVGRRVVWQNPDIDYNAKQPLATFGRFAMTEQRDSRRTETLAALSKNHGIIFFYRSDCPYCHKQAPVLAELKKRHGIDILAISMDGGPIPGFPDAKPDNGIANYVSGGEGIATVPSTFLVSNDKKTIVPLGSGVLAMEEIVDRIYLLTQTTPGTQF